MADVSGSYSSKGKNFILCTMETYISCTLLFAGFLCPLLANAVYNIYST